MKNFITIISLHTFGLLRLLRYTCALLAMTYTLLLPTFPALAEGNFSKYNAEFISATKGLKIHVVAPASGTTEPLMRDLYNIKNIELIIPRHCFDRPSAFHSNSDDIRFKCFKDAILDPTSRIIWALRGGYGSAKIISELKKLPRPPQKIFIGFSDNTALHLFLTQEWGWATIHGAGIVELLSPDKDRLNFVKLAKILTSKTHKPQISGLKPVNSIAQNALPIKGSLTGGNMTIVQTSIGTDWQIQAQDKIIFLEDVSIKPYQVDRGLLHLKQAGVFNKVKAIIFGNFDDDNKEVVEILKSFADNLNIPVFKTNRFGHRKINDPIIYNVSSEIAKSSGNDFTLTMNNPMK